MFWRLTKSIPQATCYFSSTFCALMFSDTAQTHRQAVTSLPQALHWCEQEIAARNKTVRSFTFFIAASELRATVMGPESGARGLADYVALAPHRLAVDADWAVQCALISPRIGALAVALRRELLDALQALASSAGATQVSAQPAFLAPLRASASDADTWATLIAEPGTLVTAQGQGHTLNLAIQITTDLSEALPREQARARYAAGNECVVQTWLMEPEQPTPLTAAGPTFTPRAA